MVADLDMLNKLRLGEYIDDLIHFFSRQLWIVPEIEPLLVYQSCVHRLNPALRCKVFVEKRLLRHIAADNRTDFHFPVACLDELITDLPGPADYRHGEIRYGVDMIKAYGVKEVRM